MEAEATFDGAKTVAADGAKEVGSLVLDERNEPSARASLVGPSWLLLGAATATEAWVGAPAVAGAFWGLGAPKRVGMELTVSRVVSYEYTMPR